MSELKPFSESISSGRELSVEANPEQYADIRVTNKALGEFSNEDKSKLERAGYNKKEIDAIEELRKNPSPVGFTRFTNPNQWVAGANVWKAITDFGFVDIDGKGNMHIALPRFGEVSQDILQAQFQDILQAQFQDILQAQFQDKEAGSGPSSDDEMSSAFANAILRSWERTNMNLKSSLGETEYDAAKQSIWDRAYAHMAKSIQAGTNPFPEFKFGEKNNIPHGEFYHKDVGWY